MEIKKILVKLPVQLNAVIESFPFLITLSEEFPKAEINLIIEEGHFFALCFLPFKIKIFERPKSKRSLLETHHFCANLHDVFNIDIFFDLENSFNSAFIGFNFRAKERIGYEVNWNKYLLTKKIKEPLSFSAEKKAMKLLEFYLNKDFSAVRILKTYEKGDIVNNVEKLFQEPEQPKFIMIMLDNFLNVSAQVNMWKMFFDSFQKQKIIIWSMNDENEISDLFSSIDLGQNDLFMHKGTSTKEMLYLFSKINGVVTNNLLAEGVCNFIGVNCFSFFTEKMVLPEYTFFKHQPERVFFEKENEIKYSFGDEVKEWTEMNQLVDQLHLSFKL